MGTEINKDGSPRILDYILWDGNTPINSIDFITAPNPPLIETDEGNYNNKGVKVKTDLMGTNDGKLCVRRNFIEKFEDRELHIEFQWINTDDTIYCTKKKVVKLSNAQWESRFRKQRERIFDDLKGRAVKYNQEKYVDILYAYFKDEKQDFVETGSTMFKDAIIETLSIDLSELGVEDQKVVGTVQSILNNSLDGVNKVFETLTSLTS